MGLNVFCCFLAISLATPVFAEGLDLFDLLPPEEHKPARQPSVLERGYSAPKVTVERRAAVVVPPVVVTNVVERPVEVAVEKVVTNLVEKVREVERPVTNVVERIVEKPVEVVVEHVVTNTVERLIEVERPVTSVVEKVVQDVAAVEKLKEENQRLETRGGILEAKNTDLAEQNEELTRKLAEERERRERLERVVPKAEAKALTGRPARITSATTYYDRKEGVIFFDKNVYVDDEQYQLHADKAYVFTSGTNDLRRIVAIGNVAMTNETRRAYGSKVSYYKEGGMVVLYGWAERPAEIRDESKVEDQVVRGRKIKFWIDSEQVEVLDADISAPVSGGSGDFKQAIRRTK